jgi:hypothetical protein
MAEDYKTLSQALNITFQKYAKCGTAAFAEGQARRAKRIILVR